MKPVLAVLSVVALSIVVAFAQQAPTAQQLTITNGPGVDHLSSNSAEVFWNTSEKSGSVVHYGTARDMLTESAETPGAVTDHKVQLNNLRPGTTYYFQVTSALAEKGAAEAKSGIGTFKTHSASHARNEKDDYERR